MQSNGTDSAIPIHFDSISLVGEAKTAFFGGTCHNRSGTVPVNFKVFHHIVKLQYKKYKRVPFRFQLQYLSQGLPASPGSAAFASLLVFGGCVEKRCSIVLRGEPYADGGEIRCRLL
eukprot:scaffold16062_cov278-Ochromonas_danica.AAC.3